MEQNTSKVYVLPDKEGRILRIEGGYSISNITDFSGWVLIDEGNGYRYNLCQSHYFPQPLMDERGIYRYKLVDGQPVERTEEEMDADFAALPPSPPSDHDLLQEALAALTAIEEGIASV